MSETNTDSPLGTPLSITDLDNAVKIIDYAADQGAYRGWTVIEQVQAVRNRLLAVIAATTVSAPETVNTQTDTI